MRSRRILESLALAGLASPAALGQLSAANAIKLNDAPFYMCGAHMGWAVANGGNINGDAGGVDDVLIGAPGPFQVESGACVDETPGHVSAWTGAPLRLWRQLGVPYSFTSASQIGSSVKGLGDVNGDGYADTVVSEPNYLLGAIHCGLVAVRSGFDGSILASVTPNAFASERPGTMVAAVGDVDGYPGSEFAVLAQEAQVAGGSLGNVYLYSYRAGSIVLLHTWQGRSVTDIIVGPIGAVGDVNGDGSGDLGIVSLDSAGPPRHTLRIVSGVFPYGQIGPDIVRLPGPKGASVSLPGSGPDGGDVAGEYIAPLDDLDGDGSDEFIVGAAGGPDGTAIAMVLRYDPTPPTITQVWTVHSLMEARPGDVFPGGGIGHRSVAAVPAGAAWEVLVGVSQMNTNGMAYAFDPATGALLRYYTPEPPPFDVSFRFGCAVAGGDFNGDGLGDAVIGCLDFDLDPGIPGRHGQAYLFLGTP